MGYSKKLQIIGIFIVLLCEIGCVSDEANRYYLKEKLPPKNVKDVEVLREKPQRPYIVVADFQASNGSFLFFVFPVSPERMQKMAAKVGTDAVILVPAGGWYSRDEVWAGKDTHSNSYSTLLGTAIKYKTE